MKCLKLISSSILLLDFMCCTALCEEISSVCTNEVNGNAQWSSVKQYAGEIHKELKTSLKEQSPNNGKGKMSWKSFCPVLVEPKTQRTEAALEVFLGFLHLLKENERKTKESFLFYTCNEAGTTLTTLTEATCYLKYALMNTTSTTVTNLTTIEVQDLDVPDFLEVFKKFGQCIVRAGSLKNVPNCADIVFTGCKSGGKKKKGRKGKGRKGKGRKGRKGRKGKGRNRKGRKGRKGAKKGGKDN